MDDDVVDALLDAAAPRLAAYGFLLTGTTSAGDDLVQAAIVKVLVRHRRLADVRVAEGQVRAEMRTIHLDAVRRAGSWRARLPRFGSRADMPDAVAQLAPSDQVGRALSSLSPRERAVIVLRHHDHLQILEIAAAMRIAEEAVEGLLSRAHATLAGTLGEIEPELDLIPIVDRRRR